MSENHNNQEQFVKELNDSRINIDKYTKLLKIKEIDSQDRLATILWLTLFEVFLYFLFNYFWSLNSVFYILIFVLVFIQIFLSYPIFALISHALLINVTKLEDRLQEYEIQNELREAKDELTRQNIMMRKNYFHLQKYYKQSLNQSKNIFYFGLFLAILGLTSIPVIIYLKLENSSTLAIIQAVLTGFVLVVFQLMYIKTNESVNSFYQGLIESYKENLKSSK